jgi:hypothetical protein
MGVPPVARTRLIAAAFAALLTTPLSAQGGGSGVHVLLVTGLSAEPQYARVFAQAASTIYDAAKKSWGVADSSLIYLAEDPTADPIRIHGVSNRETVQRSIELLSRRVRPGDVVFFFVLGHGNGEGAESKVNLPGPDPTASDYNGWLAAFPAQSVLFVNASSGSGDFVAVTSGPNRVIVTATKTALERNETHFAEFFARGLSGTEADADKDGRVSALEAFNFAHTEVAKFYTGKNLLQTEHALLDDNGDGKGSGDPGTTENGDGRLARRIAFGGASASTDPRVIALMAERRVLEIRLDSLRAHRATTDSTSYQKALELLLTDIAVKSQAIRDIQKGGHE